MERKACESNPVGKSDGGKVKVKRQSRFDSAVCTRVRARAEQGEGENTKLRMNEREGGRKEPQECRHSTSPRVGLCGRLTGAELPRTTGRTGGSRTDGGTATLHEFPTGKKDELAKLFKVGVVGPFAVVVIRNPDHRRRKIADLAG